MNDVEKKLAKLLSDHFAQPAEEIVTGTTMQDLGMDSLDGVELMMLLEEEFAIEIDDGAAAEAITPEATVADLARFVTSQKGEGATS
ncbi:acyl carrier protein [Loktanella atrilutea]|uniref:Acyl carrier protein n=1 Tax=Loktanella atrilutea TaxID=366533 RepID=A0A1M4W9F2_LOKAT|nr:acyl carrier protein [Loktanella atrilutea]SHE77839.1 acyl carrier protein [Loktanella atrilutea]